MTMGEFGHVYGRSGGFHFDSWGIGPFFITDENGKQYCFEDSDCFGPSLLGKKGDPLSKQPGERSPFWRAHSLWVRQGRRLEDGKNCIWDEPKPQTVRMIGKRTCVVVDRGEEGGKTIVLPPAVSQGDQS